MRFASWCVLIGLLIWPAVGCNQGNSPPQTGADSTTTSASGDNAQPTTVDSQGQGAQSSPFEAEAAAAKIVDDGPQIENAPDAVTGFLAAVRSGNDTEAERLLTLKARKEMARRELVIQPPGTPTAQFTIGRTELDPMQEGAAYVSSTWQDEQEGENAKQYEIVWILRKEERGWRIGGMATRLFEDQSPLVLNFENPDEMLAKMQQAEEEMMRRAQQASVNTTASGTPAQSPTGTPPAAGAAGTAQPGGAPPTNSGEGIRQAQQPTQGTSRFQQ